MSFRLSSDNSKLAELIQSFNKQTQDGGIPTNFIYMEFENSKVFHFSPKNIKACKDIASQINTEETGDIKYIFNVSSFSGLFLSKTNDSLRDFIKKKKDDSNSIMSIIEDFDNIKENSNNTIDGFAEKRNVFFFLFDVENQSLSYLSLDESNEESRYHLEKIVEQVFIQTVGKSIKKIFEQLNEQGKPLSGIRRICRIL